MCNEKSDKHHRSKEPHHGHGSWAHEGNKKCEHNFFQVFHDFWKQYPESTLRQLMRETGEHLRKTLGTGRVNVVMVRVEDDMLDKIDFLVEHELFRSRSEAAAFLISKGLEATEDIVEEVMKKAEQIEKLRKEIRDILGVKEEEAAGGPDESAGEKDEAEEKAE